MTESYLKNKKALQEYFITHGYLTSLKAMNTAEGYHCNLRKSGDPEFSHQVYIASFAIQTFLPRLNNPDAFLAAVFTHDLVEDYKAKYGWDDLINDLGMDVYRITKSVTKPEEFVECDEHKGKYYAACEEVPEGPLLKASDRIHNMVTMIDVFTIPKQKSYIIEVETYILPMLKRARKTHPYYKEAYLAVKFTLERQIIFLKEIHRLHDCIENMK